MSKHPISVLSIGLGGMYPHNENKYNGSLERQIDYGEHIEKYHVITRTNSNVYGHLEPKEIQNVTIYPTNSTGILGYIYNSIKIASELVSREGIDLITCANAFHAGVSGLIVSKINNIPLNISEMSNVFGNDYFIKEHPVRNRLAVYLGHKILSRADGIRVSTEYGAQKLQKIYGNKVWVGQFYVDQTPFESVDEEQVEKVRAQLTRDDDESLLLFVGRLSSEKCLDTLIKAVDRLVSASNNVRLAIIGDGDERAKLQGLVETLELQGRVSLLGLVPHSEVAKYYKASDLFILPSHREGTSMVLLEAALTKTPIVATKVGGAIDLLGEFEEDALCTKKDEGELADKIARLLNRPDYCDHIANKLYSKVRSDYRPEELSRRRAEGWYNLV